MTTAGNLRHRITIQKPSTEVDDLGQPVDNWIDVATRWAAVEPLAGREYWAAQQVQAETSVRVTLRYLPGIKTTMRVLFNGRALEILSVINVGERNKELQLMCREVI